MKLCKDNKQCLEVGDILQFGISESYTVKSVHFGTDRFKSPGSVSITVICPDGRMIYCTPASGFYGAKIIKTGKAES